jgi:hypothetical protein
MSPYLREVHALTIGMCRSADRRWTGTGYLNGRAEFWEVSRGSPLVRTLDVVLGAKEAEDCVVEVTATGYDGLEGRLDQLPRSGDQLYFWCAWGRASSLGLLLSFRDDVGLLF